MTLPMNFLSRSFESAKCISAQEVTALHASPGSSGAFFQPCNTQPRVFWERLVVQTSSPWVFCWGVLKVPFTLLQVLRSRFFSPLDAGSQVFGGDGCLICST